MRAGCLIFFFYPVSDFWQLMVADVVKNVIGKTETVQVLAKVATKDVPLRDFGLNLIQDIKRDA